MRRFFGTFAIWFLGLAAGAFVACEAPLPATEAPGEPTVCPRDIKLCRDGTAVGRSGSDCDFDPCPETAKGGGLSPDPAPQGPDGGPNPKPMGTFNPSEPPPG